MTPAELAAIRDGIRSAPDRWERTPLGTINTTAIPKNDAMRALHGIGPAIDDWHSAEVSASAMSRQTHSRTQIRQARRLAAELQGAAEAEALTATTALATFDAAMQDMPQPVPASPEPAHMPVVLT